MEENNPPAGGTTIQAEPQIVKSPRFNQSLFLPTAILIAAVLISGTLLYTKRATAPTGSDQPLPTNVKIDVTANDHILGDAKAEVTVIEFADFRCPFCERFFTQAEANIKKDYVDTGKVRFVFKHYAFLGQQSVWAAEASECASEQGKFWEYHDWLYQNQAPETNLAYYSKTNLIKYAGKISGINTSQFAACLNSDKYAKRVTDDLSLGNSSGVTGTPTSFINGTMIVGAQPDSVFQAAIDSALKKGTLW